MLIFSPWAFGTTQRWSSWTMNLCGYSLGILLGIKTWIRHVTKTSGSIPGSSSRFGFNRRTTAHLLGALTSAILLYCFISAVNARATFDALSGQLRYHDCVAWLPHSLDSRGSWDAFLRLLALSCSFWAAHDWLRAPDADKPRTLKGRADAAVSTRIRRLLWLLTLSGGLLALEGITQRIARSPKLLFLMLPEFLADPATQFASFAYRGNAGQYFNLLWPVCFGLWWTGRRTRPNHSILHDSWKLVCIGLMAACPLLSSARGAALVDVAMLALAGTVFAMETLARDDRHYVKKSRGEVLLIACFMGASLSLGAGLGWKELWPRLGQAQADLKAREELYERARLIAGDYDLFGTGPGTFGAVFQLYRKSPDDYWPAQLHNDWLETRLTFGWTGTALIGSWLLVLVLGELSRGSARAHWPLNFCLWLALAGCLVQARWDFPLQVYSILFLFMIWCSMLLADPEASEHPPVAAGFHENVSPKPLTETLVGR
ncbi:MAG TPA: O-antigen ligase family protein [Verrucomicrobiae bacterium]|nr:O-antigen ligase family protein [Verrucomicrobiae bacterium]